MAAVAAGAFAAAAAGQTMQSTGSSEASAKPGSGSSTGVTPLASGHDATASFAMGGDAPSGAPTMLQAAGGSPAASEVEKLDQAQQVTKAREQREANDAKKAAEEAAKPKTVRPAEGAFTSGFGARWGTSHNGIDIANKVGTPIVAASDGTVIEAGPASGFGLWVRVQLDDGTIQVYGHMNSFDVHEGQHVKAGEKIAEIGQRGQATGPHLHFEVWVGGGKKIDPQPWLTARGVKL